MGINFKEKTKSFIVGKKEAFKGLKKGQKIAIGIASGTVIMATVFGVIYGMQNKYDILFYDLNAEDSARISKTLEEQKVDMQVKGGNIYVPKKDVDKLRLDLAPTVENGSKGFELMDEGSSMGMTDDEFALKKKRMLNGEIEKTIKTFPQVDDVRVNITEGVKSAFSNEVEPGSGAVSILLKTGYSLDEGQVRSIISLVSASSENVPKENVEVVDQDLNLLSEGLYDKDGKSTVKNSEKLEEKRLAEETLNNSLTKRLLTLLEPIYGKGNVKVMINSDLLFDEEEIKTLTIDPNKVIVHEERTEDNSKDTAKDGNAVDNNMNNKGEDGVKEDTSKSESIDYAVGKTENNKIVSPGEIKKLTATVAIDGALDDNMKKELEAMVTTALSIDEKRGDAITVTSMAFKGLENDDFAAMEEAKKQEELKKMAMLAGIGALIVIGGITYAVIRGRKNRQEEEVYSDEEVVEELEPENVEEVTEELMSVKIKEDEKLREKTKFDISEESKSLEDEAKEYAKNNINKVAEVVKLWLSE